MSYNDNLSFAHALSTPLDPFYPQVGRGYSPSRIIPQSPQRQGRLLNVEEDLRGSPK